MARLDQLPWYKRWYWGCYFLIGFWYYKIIYKIRDYFRDKWLTFKYRKEAAEVRAKYLSRKGNIWPHDDNFPNL